MDDARKPVGEWKPFVIAYIAKTVLQLFQNLFFILLVDFP
jgi:hypothetical protein